MSYVAATTERFDAMAQFRGEGPGFAVAAERDRAHGRGRQFDQGGGPRLEILGNRRDRMKLPLGTPGDRMHVVAEIGAAVMPPMPAFHLRSATLAEVADQIVNLTLDMLDIEMDLDLFPRRQGAPEVCIPSKEIINGEVVP